jgi:hypothetical protein
MQLYSLEKLELAYEQLEKVKKGEMPSEEGKVLISKISEMECIQSLKTRKDGRNLENIK